MKDHLKGRRLLLAAAALLWAAPLRAQIENTLPDMELVPSREMPPREEIPGFLRWMLHPLRRGMMLNIPMVDTDPNRGVEYGVMPVWVIPEENGDRIQQIHAPSLTYNQDFGVSPCYRYYLYPEEDSSLLADASVNKYEHEIFAQFDDKTFLGSHVDGSLRGQWTREASQRFYGFGPNSQRGHQTNYTEDYIQYRVTFGLPVMAGSRWRIHASDMLTGDKVGNGPLPGLPSFSSEFPRSSAAATNRQTIHADRFILDYDSRDSIITTSQGGFLQTFAEYAAKNFGSEVDYSRYGLDGRFFRPCNEEHTIVTAAQVKFEQLVGNAPFWLQPRMGGKESLRAYGSGRYTDRGLLVANIEQRFTVYKEKMAGISTEFEVDPFAGIGTVFLGPERMARRYARPVVGIATRAVARPQVVGSVDVGVGQEGVAVFMDINYSF